MQAAASCAWSVSCPLPLPAVFKVEKNVDNSLVKPRDPHRLLDTHRLHFHSDQVGHRQCLWHGLCVACMGFIGSQEIHATTYQPSLHHTSFMHPGRTPAPGAAVAPAHVSPVPHSTATPLFFCLQGATDLIALLSLSAAKEGGDSKWVSSLAIHNELLRRGRKVSPPACLPGTSAAQ